jgi:hypothetical protein
MRARCRGYASRLCSLCERLIVSTCLCETGVDRLASLLDTKRFILNIWGPYDFTSLNHLTSASSCMRD